MKKKLAGTRVVGALALLAAPLTACASADRDSGDITLVVYAASSLKTTFEQLGEQFEADHPGVDVEFNFAGSSDLVSQIQQGAPVDIFASADIANMDKLAAQDQLGGQAQVFATNTLEIAVPPANPAQIGALADLAKEGVQLVVCAPEVPCGSAARKVESAAGLDWKPVSEEQSVADVLNKVTTGEADAGLVYVTDVKSAGAAVQGIEFPLASEAVNAYPVAPVKGGEQSDLARQFIQLVLGSEGQAVLAAAGFGKP
ncbi:molybdate ABC transporter substrate-binding protein [Nocardioides cavernaquae]|uniref:Molybdate ABC transporter substrate-binding protein n=1 Tax=Nocardioides cavernaquae TaxID=2321396 RepID=A0A3A5HDI1_9ACTN|nr:molybdate ABC transporter substrate-binding protein [Nocardioides cavernaquae]RJS46060.1 molybdate ABC transporter substrate-binding protein [Nocardioides cavernaquae]